MFINSKQKEICIIFTKIFNMHIKVCKCLDGDSCQFWILSNIKKMFKGILNRLLIISKQLQKMLSENNS